jgi:phosphopantetheinyl transferase (holo-ACP synthase)
VSASPFQTVFTAQLLLPPLAPGVCVAVSLPSALSPAAGPREGGDGRLAPSRLSRLGVFMGELHAEETARAEGLRTASRQLEYVAGRVALRRALLLSGCVGPEAFGVPLLSTDTGAVRMPTLSGQDGAVEDGASRLLGSISHTRGLCVAIVAGSDDRGRILAACAPNGGRANREDAPRTEQRGDPSRPSLHVSRPPSSGAALDRPAAAGVACGGVARASVGVDVERTDRRAVTKMANRVLGEEERKELTVREHHRWKAPAQGIHSPLPLLLPKARAHAQRELIVRANHPPEG